MKFEACVKCGKDLIPAPAKFDGEPTFVGYLPHDCTPVKECLQQILTMQENNLPSVDGIIEKLGDKNWKGYEGRLYSRPQLVKAMQEYASLLVAQRDKKIEEIIDMNARLFEKKQLEINEFAKQRDHYKALAEAASQIFLALQPYKISIYDEKDKELYQIGRYKWEQLLKQDRPESLKTQTP